MASLTSSRRLVTALVLGFTAVGLSMAIFGVGPDRAWGLLVLLLFGVGGAAWVAGDWLTGGPQQPYNGTALLPSGNPVPALILPLRAGRVRAGLAIVAALFVSAVVLAIFAEAFGEQAAMRLFWIPLAAVLGLALAATWRRRQQGGYMLALTREGILVRLPAEASLVPWRAARTAEVVERLGQRYLTLDLEPDGQVEQEGGFPGDRLGSQLLLGHDWSVSLAALPLSPAEVLVLVRTYLEDPGRRGELGAGQVPAPNPKSA